MDPLSALASSIAVAGLAQKVIKKTAQAFDHFRDAPVELNSLRRNVLLLQSLAKRIEARRTRLSLHDEVEQSLRDCLLEAEAAINDLLEESAKYVQPKNELCKRSRLKWAFVGSPAMEKFERRIKKTLDALNSIILTIILDSQDSVMSSQDLILAGQKSFSTADKKWEIFHQLSDQKCRKTSCHEGGLSANIDAIGSAFPPEVETVAQISQPRRTICQPYALISKSPSWLWYVGLLGSMVQRKGMEAITFSVSARYRLPKTWKRHQYLLMLDFAFRVMKGTGRTTGLYFSLMSLNIVPESAEIIQACKHGALDLIKELFGRNCASIYDVTPDNISLLCLAIGSGNLELVRFLLDEGADVNQTFGYFQTYIPLQPFLLEYSGPFLTAKRSPLQRALYLGMYDITRLLLSRQANGEHVSAWRGWSPLLYLLEGASRFEGTQPHGLLDFLDALNNDSIYVDTEAQAHTEQNALQLASAWYSGEVVQRLFNLGASMASFGRRPWRYPGNPIWNAIYKNNISAFQVLLEHYEDLNALDRRKFSMIGYTARNGHIEMTSLLLERGAEHIVPNYDPEVDGDIKIVGFPVPSSKDTALKDDHEQLGTYGHDNFEKESDDADFDLNDKEGIEPWTRKNYMKYLDALNRHGRVTIRANDNDEGGADDVFWDATSDPWEYFGT